MRLGSVSEPSVYGRKSGLDTRVSSFKALDQAATDHRLGDLVAALRS
jgi:hypothetical protein